MNNNNLIILNCKKNFPTLPEPYNSLELQLLFTFYLKNGICYSGNINELKSSRNIEINTTNKTISFCKRNSELQEIKNTIFLNHLSIIAKYTPFVSYKHYYYISTILEHFNELNLTSRLELNKKNILQQVGEELEQNSNISINTKINTKINSNKQNKINKFIQNANKKLNISTNLQGETVKNALNIIKNMNDEDRIRYVLLFVLYFFPLDVLDKSISTALEGLYSYRPNTKDFLKRILLSYIINVYPNNRDLANENTNLLFTYFYNEDLFKIYKNYFINIISESNITKKYLSRNGIRENNVNYNIDCKLHKFYSQRNSCTLNSYNFSSITLLTNFNKYSITNEMYHLLSFIQGKGNVQRTIIVNIDPAKNHSKSFIIIREKNVDYKFPYDLIKKIAEKSTYVSFHQLLTIKYIYNRLKINDLDLFDHLIATIIYLYGNREFKDKFSSSSKLSSIKLYNLPTKNRLNNINDVKKNEIINKVIKIYIYLQKQCTGTQTEQITFLSTLNINQIINLYNQLMSATNQTTLQRVATIFEQFMYITSCSVENPVQNLGVVTKNICLPIKSCKLEEKSKISQFGNRFRKLF